MGLQLFSVIFTVLAAVRVSTPLQQVPDSSYLDSESSVTTSVVPIERSQSEYSLLIPFTGTPSNNVEISFGGNTGFTAGWDCGSYFVSRTRDRRRWVFPVSDSDTNKWLRYRCVLSGGTPYSIFLETPEGHLTPDGIPQRKKHVLRWEMAANTQTTNDYLEAYLSNLSFPDHVGPAVRPGAETAADLGCPDYPLSRSGSFLRHTTLPDCLFIRCYSNETASLETEIYTYAAGGQVSFEWCAYRSSSSLSPSFKFFVDGVQQYTATPVDLRPDDHTNYPHTLRWSFSGTRSPRAEHVGNDVHSEVYDMVFADRDVGQEQYGGISAALGLPDLEFTGTWIAEGSHARTPAFNEGTGTRTYEMTAVPRFKGDLRFTLESAYPGHTASSTVEFYLDGVLKKRKYMPEFIEPTAVTVSVSVPDGRLFSVTNVFSAGSGAVGTEWASFYYDCGTDESVHHDLRWVHWNTYGSDVFRAFSRFGPLSLSSGLSLVRGSSLYYCSSALGHPEAKSWIAAGDFSRWSIGKSGVPSLVFWAESDNPGHLHFAMEAVGSGILSFPYAMEKASGASDRIGKLMFFVDGIPLGSWSSVCSGTATYFIPAMRMSDIWLWDGTWSSVTVLRRGAQLSPVSGFCTREQVGGYLQLK